MFKLTKDRTFKRQITVVMPAEDGNGETKGTFTARFRIVGQNELDKLLQTGDVAMLDAVLEGVEGIADAAGQALPQDVALDAVKNDALAVAAIAAEYIEVIKARNFRRGQR